MDKKRAIITELMKYRKKAIRQEIAEATIPEVARLNSETADAVLAILQGINSGDTDG